VLFVAYYRYFAVCEY